MNIEDRIRLIVEQSKIKKGDFAKKIDITPTYLSLLLRGGAIPSDRVINDIKREFNVNSNWLLTGKGNMYNDVTRENEVARFMGRVLKNKDSNIFKLIHALAKLDEDELEFLANITLKFAEEQKKDD